MEWLSDDKFKKYVGLARLCYNEIFQPFKMYGQDAHIPGAIDQCISVAIILSEIMRGKNKPLSMDYIKKKLAEKEER